MEEIIVPSGIGDGLWVAQSLDPKKKYHVKICDQGKQRAHKLWELFDFVKKITYINGKWDQHCTHEFNSKLHEGIHLEDAAENLNWRLVFRTSGDEKKAAAKTVKRSKVVKKFYVGIYASSYETSRALQGWGLSHWQIFLNKFSELVPNVHFVFLGADYDDLTRDLMQSVTYQPTIDKLGASIGETYELLKKLDLMVGFQSGIGCLSTYLDKKTIMLFSKRYEKMQSTFCRKESIEKTWKGCQFCAPEQLVSWYKSTWHV